MLLIGRVLPTTQRLKHTLSITEQKQALIEDVHKFANNYFSDETHKYNVCIVISS
jgi:hypothetical protein